MTITNVFTDNYGSQFEEYVSLLWYLAGKSKTTYEERIEKAASLTEAYTSFVQKPPDHRQLDRLSTLVLYDDVMDTNPYKVAHTEYPILSDTQLDRRRLGGRGAESSMSGETSLSAAESIAVDGRDYRYPNRRKRSIGELLYVDNHTKIRNKERAEQYRRDTAEGVVVTYNLHDTGGELLLEFIAAQSVAQTWRDRLCLVQ